MSTSLAHALPGFSPAGGDQRRHIEIVTTRHQRRARPRVVYAVITVVSLFAILMAQLLLSIVLSEGAYDISSLQGQQRELTRSQQALSEELDVLSSPQNLASRAEALGMVSNASPAFLRLSDSAVLGSPVAAKAGVGGFVGAGGSGLIPNALLPTLPDIPQVAPVPGATVGETGGELTGLPASTPGAPQNAGLAGSVAATTTEGLPAPVTR